MSTRSPVIRWPDDHHISHHYDCITAKVGKGHPVTSRLFCPPVPSWCDYMLMSCDVPLPYSCIVIKYGRAVDAAVTVCVWDPGAVCRAVCDVVVVAPAQICCVCFESEPWRVVSVVTGEQEVAQRSGPDDMCNRCVTRVNFGDAGGKVAYFEACHLSGNTAGSAQCRCKGNAIIQMLIGAGGNSNVEDCVCCLELVDTDTGCRHHCWSRPTRDKGHRMQR